jgi:hypothetical protein
VETNGITLVVGRPLVPDVKTDAIGTLSEVRFTVDRAIDGASAAMRSVKQ